MYMCKRCSYCPVRVLSLFPRNTRTLEKGVFYAKRIAAERRVVTREKDRGAMASSTRLVHR